MTKLYLITGFLGAGKTTFLQKFTGLFPNQKIALVINEFGAEGVDGTLLQDLSVQLTEINNGSIFCACKLEQFEDAVRNIMEIKKPDLILWRHPACPIPPRCGASFSRGPSRI